ncbi:MAG TPA: LysM peptidoglycan-binding domain-containing protein, partial [Agromyces sp.]|nr:LysM peptidoglycan-binding domain-containing protein [Agromyces sp.]
VTLGIVQPAEAAAQPLKRQAKAKAQTGSTVRTAPAVAASTPPSEYVVVDGDTVSGVAERFGLATAEVLAFNGLGWSSLIFPGQRLALPGGVAADAAPPAPAPAPEITKHVVVEGDTVSGIAAAYGLDVASVLSANGLAASSLIFPGEAIVLPLPGGAPTAPSAPAEPAPPAAEASPAPVDGGSHVVVAGDTLSGIAAAYGVTVAELDAANGLGGSTLIVPGQVLVLHAPVAVVTVASVDVPLTDEMRGNAQIIIDVGRALGVPDQGIVAALAAAAQESGLRNVRHGDRDSLGLFQQRPSQGWGTIEQVLDPVRAATAFYGGAANPNPGRTIGLLDIDGWESLTITQAAQAVQQSAYPDHYAKWEASARAWLSELG